MSFKPKLILKIEGWLDKHKLSNKHLLLKHGKKKLITNQVKIFVIATIITNCTLLWIFLSPSKLLNLVCGAEQLIIMKQSLIGIYFMILLLMNTLLILYNSNAINSIEITELKLKLKGEQQ